MSSQIGNILKVSLFGESHGTAIGAVIDGFPPGFEIDEERLLAFMARRAPGRDRTATPRRESDLPRILSGVRNGITCGTPIAAVIENADQHSGDYSRMASAARPGHADYTGYLRYRGSGDVRGGGHFSARLTAPLTFAGGLCLQYLEKRGICIGAHLLSVRDAEDTPFPETDPTPEQVTAPGKKKFPVLDDSAEERIRAVIEEARQNEDSVGGVVEVAVTGMPAGIGSPIFDTLEGRLSFGYFGIPAVKGVEFGAGFRAAGLYGSENNDAFYIDEGGSVKTRSNHHGGILGGISSGMPVIARLAFKPTPSIGREQETVDFIRKEETKLRIAGRHDPCVAVRAVPVVEAMTAVVLTDMLLEQEGCAGEGGEPRR